MAVSPFAYGPGAARYRVWDRSCRMYLYSPEAVALHNGCVLRGRRE